MNRPRVGSTASTGDATAGDSVFDEEGASDVLGVETEVLACREDLVDRLRAVLDTREAIAAAASHTVA